MAEPYSDLKELRRLVAHCEKNPDEFDSLFTLAIALRIGTIFQEDAVVAESPDYLMIELHKDHHDCPYTAAHAVIVRMAKKVLQNKETTC